MYLNSFLYTFILVAMLSSQEKQYLEDIWSDPKHPAAFSGPEKLYKFVKKDGQFKIGLSAINRFLSSLEAYSLQKRVQRKFKRSPVLVEGIDAQWDGDLMDVRNISKYNQNYQYILVLQDVFSRFISTAPLKNKTASEIISGLKSILKQGRQPELLRTDRGKEFKNRFLTVFLKERGIHQIFSENETKSNFAERSIQNLQNRLTRMFMYNQSYEYFKQLSDITKAINNTPSRPLGNMAPSEVNKSNEDEVRLREYLVRTKTKINKGSESVKKLRQKKVKKSKRSPYQFKLNDKVRITQEKTKFMREYSQKWTGEIFIVTRRFMRHGVPVYKLKDFANTALTGSYYSQELQGVDTHDIWKVSKILKKRKNPSGETELLVSWHQWPSKFDSWIKESDLQEAP